MNYVVLTFRLANNQADSYGRAQRIAGLVLNVGEHWTMTSHEMTVTLAQSRVAEFANDMVKEGLWED